MADWKLPVNCKKCRDHTGRDFPTLRKMAEFWKVEYQTLLARLKKGWPVDKALTAPLDRRGRKLGGPQS